MALNIPWHLFRKLLRENISETEHRQLLDWQNESPLNKLVFDEVMEDQDFRKLLLSESSINESREWEKILERIKPQPKIILNPKTFYWISAAAAAILLFIGISAGIWFINRKHTAQQVPDGYTYVYSPRGQRTQMVLPDHSRVWLNSETSIRYPVNFNSKLREVYIEGEAFFQVAKNPQKPFVVNTSDIKVKVYGTSFNVKAYPKEKTIETTLIEGKLSVIPNTGENKNEKEIFLVPRERLTYTKTQSEKQDLSLSAKHQSGVQDVTKKASLPAKIFLAKNVDMDKEQAWKDGKIMFRDEQFSDLAIKLERWYDVKIHFDDNQIKTYRFTGKFDKETINEAMEALKLSSQQSYRYEIVFRDIYLRSK